MKAVATGARKPWKPSHPAIPRGDSWNGRVVTFPRAKKGEFMQQTKRGRRTGRQHPSAEYKAEVVAAFVASGRTIAEVAHEYNLTELTLREWIRQAADEVVGAGRAGPEAH